MKTIELSDGRVQTAMLRLFQRLAENGENAVRVVKYLNSNPGCEGRIVDFMLKEFCSSKDDNSKPVDVDMMQGYYMGGWQ